MATRKRPPEQSSFFAFPTFKAPAPEQPWAPRPDIHIEVPEAPPPDLTPVVAERKLRIVPPAAEVPSEEVLVEAIGNGRFLVSTLRDHGTTVAAVYYTRSQLEMLLKRIPAALEVGT